MSGWLVILGATARAAAFSALRAGMQPWCADLFADADLARVCPVRRVSLQQYPDGLLDALAYAPVGAIAYTGGLDNRPDLVSRIDRPTWGNSAEVLRDVRSPFLLADTLRRHGMPALAVCGDPPPLADGRAWLLKPLRSGGGVGIRPYVGQAFDPQTHYLQEYCPGLCFGAVFLGSADGQSLLLGVTHQFASSLLDAPEFHYCGSMGPIQPMPADVRALGEMLAREFSLRGLFGVDFVYRVDPETGQEACFLLEVNPRYTASVEVLERAFGVPLLGLHREVFENERVSWRPPAATKGIHGKAIVYAREDVIFPADGPWLASLRHALADGDAEYADIPHAGEPIRRGDPVLTVFASAASESGCLRQLRDRVGALARRLWG